MSPIPRVPFQSLNVVPVVVKWSRMSGDDGVTDRVTRPRRILSSPGDNVVGKYRGPMVERVHQGGFISGQTCSGLVDGKG